MMISDNQKKKVNLKSHRKNVSEVLQLPILQNQHKST